MNELHIFLDLQENMAELEKHKYTINRNKYKVKSDYCNKYTKQTYELTKNRFKVRTQKSYT